MKRSQSDADKVLCCHPKHRIPLAPGIPCRPPSLIYRNPFWTVAGRSFPRTVLASFLVLVLLSPAPAFPEEKGSGSPSALPGNQIPTDRELVDRGAVIGDIRILPENIFDIEDPRENNWLFRLANRLHARTRPWVVKKQLLFRSGDPYNPRLLAESERILRSNWYLYDARIRPIAFEDGRVDIEVRTRDVWTLQPGFSFGRQGGENTTSIDLREKNLFGLGSEIGIASSSDPDRDTESLNFADEHLFGTWLRTSIVLEDSSDGGRRSFLLERPFYSLDTRWAASGFYNDDDRIDTLVGVESIASRYRTRSKLYQVYGGWSPGLRERRVWRFFAGAKRDESRFSEPPEGTGGLPVPADRVLVYPFVGFALTEDDFEKAKNRDQIERTEDFFLGTRLSATLGYATPQFGSDRYAVPFSVSFGKGGHLRERWTILVDGIADGRVEHGKVQDTALEADGRVYLRVSRSLLSFASLSLSRLIKPDDDHQLVLGGETGLRGYPRQYQAGDRRFLFTVEQRYFTDWYPFRLFYIGGAIFFDAGRAWGGNVVDLPDSGLLKDVGFGLRIGNSRSGLGNMIHVDLAFPLDGDPSIDRVQFLVETKQSF
ncbi:MAG TPA: hypothetical protein DEH27_04960 [Deltaproteobacteria bacterium]|nr:hypothetical protein [Deltaproteobacteria bacterium]